MDYLSIPDWVVQENPIGDGFFQISTQDICDNLPWENGGLSDRKISNTYYESLLGLNETGDICKILGRRNPLKLTILIVLYVFLAISIHI